MTDLVAFYKVYWGVDLTKMLRGNPELKPDLERLREMVTKSYDEIYNDDLFGPEKKKPLSSETVRNLAQPFIDRVKKPATRREACRRCGGDIYERPAEGGCYC